MSAVVDSWSPQCANSLAAAFQDDLAMQFIFADPAKRCLRLPKLYEALASATRRSGFILRTENGEAVSLWRNPGMAHDGLIDTVRSTPAFLGALGSSVRRALQIDRSIASNLPKQPFYYLQVLGTRPDFHGNGFGGALLRAGIERAEQGSHPIFLETSRIENVSLYKRFGFEVTKEWTVPNGGPKFFGMMRVATDERVL